MPGFIAIFIAFAAYGVLHSWLASVQVKQTLQRWSGLSAMRFYRLAYNVLAGLLLLPIGLLAISLPDQDLYRIPFPWVLVTSILQGLAALAALAAVWQTGLGSFIGIRQVTGAGQPQTLEGEDSLVTGGLYAWVRHPIYTAGMVFIWLQPVMTANILAFSAAMTLYFLFGAVVEERKLTFLYGEAYRAYRRRTPMFIPGLTWPNKKT